MTRARTPVAIVGASGYTGAELLRLLLDHPAAEIAGIYARASAGQPLATVFPHFAGRLDRVLEPFDADALAARAKFAFSALPHGESLPVIQALADRGVTVLDLSADLRLADAAEHSRWYGGGAAAHETPLRARAVYGLPERHRDALRTAQIVAVPGCYPTGAILAIAPLLQAKLVHPDLVVDSKSGVTGAGRSPSPTTHFAEVDGGLRPYKVAGTHRHTPEIEQELTRAAGEPVRITFTPHLVPMARGILTCVYATPRDEGLTAERCHAALAAAYAGEPFVTVLPPGALPDTSFVRGSNRAHVAVAFDARAGRVLALSAIDNLVKGASGQAVQCLNLLLGVPETTGLEAVAVFP